MGRCDAWTASSIGAKEGAHHVAAPSGGQPGPDAAREPILFSRRQPVEEFATALYVRTAERARAAELFEDCGIPDTLDGRFDALALHAALAIDRLQREPDGDVLAQAFFDAMFRHLDLTLREIGVQDLGAQVFTNGIAEALKG